ncbi:ABC-2 family transporter protein [Candidatus Dojkabacteria bacterium]|nr:ABC-2 family transporter protein [Candidatus Dojkabacteria bacterium]
MLVFIQVVFIHAVVGTSDNFVGWSTNEMYLLLGVYNAVNYLSWSMFSINLWRLEEKILKGDFNSLLLRPASSLFSAAFSDFFIDDAISAVSGLILIAYYLVVEFKSLRIENILLGLVGVVCAFLIWFSLETLFASFDFLYIKNGMRQLKQSLTNVARFPTEIWDSNVRVIFYTLFPIAFVASVPAGLVTGIFNWQYAIYGLIISILMFFFSKAIWNICIKKYNSYGG